MKIGVQKISYEGGILAQVKLVWVMLGQAWSESELHSEGGYILENNPSTPFKRIRPKPEVPPPPDFQLGCSTYVVRIFIFDEISSGPFSMFAFYSLQRLYQIQFDPIFFQVSHFVLQQTSRKKRNENIFLLRKSNKAKKMERTTNITKSTQLYR